MTRLTTPQKLITYPSGFTLVEIMVAMTMAAIIMAAAISSYMAQQRIQISQDQLVGVQQNIRAGITRMSYDIRMAGCNPNENATDTSCNASPATATAAVAPGVHTATATQFGFSMDLNGDNDCNDSGENVTYNIYTDGDGIDNLGRKNPTNNASLGEHLEAIEFLYTLKNGSQLISPSAAQLNDITDVHVSLLGRTAQPDRDYTNANLYIPASGTTPLNGTQWDFDTGAGISSVPNDQYRRQFLSMQISLRNMRL